MSILMAEDDLKLSAGLKVLLEIEGYKTDCAASGAEALELFELAADKCYDMVLLDWMMPELSGIEVCRILRKKYNYQGGIIFLTAKSDLENCVEALNKGADDYITKPFEIKELVARIKAVDRRKSKPLVDEVYKYKDLSIDCVQCELTVADKQIKFSKTEFAILKILFINVQKIIPRDTLLEAVWEDNLEVGRASLDSCIYNLRKKLKPVAERVEIKMERSIGYRLEIK